MNSNTAKQMTSFDKAMNAANALNSEPMKQLVQLAEGARKKLGISPSKWADLSEQLVEVLEGTDEKTQAVWCAGATEGINEVVDKYAGVKTALKGRQYGAMKARGFLSAPALHPKNFVGKSIRHFTYSIDGHIEADFNYGTAEIGRGDRSIEYCEEMVKETLIASGYKMDDMLAFQINNNDDCFMFKVCDFNLVARDALKKLPIKAFIYACKPTEFRFLGRRLYGICFTDPNVEKTGLTIHPPCLFADMVAEEKKEGSMTALDTNTYWFFNEEAADAFGKAVMGIQFVICPHCSKFFEEKTCEKLTCALVPFLPNHYENRRGDTNNFYCGDCVLIGKNRLKAEEEAVKSRAEMKARMYEPIRATAEAQLLEMLEDKKPIEEKKVVVKTETTKERNKRLAAEAAKELKAEKKRKEEHLKACGLYKSPEQLKKEREARFKAEIAQMSRRK